MPIFSYFFTRQSLANPIKQQEIGGQPDKDATAAVQIIFKKVKKSLVRPRNLH